MYMKKTLFAIALTLFSTGAMAKWMTVGKSEGATGFTVYADKASVKKTGNMSKMWSMFDFNSTMESKDFRYLSYRQLVEYECKEKKNRVMEYSLHSKHMGNGGAIYKNMVPGKWEMTAPKSVAENLLEIACKK
jgi:hypothetical protein